MAIVSVIETKVRDSSSEGLGNQSGPSLIQKFTATRQFITTSDDKNDGPTIAAADSRVPQFGQAHPKDTTLIVNEVSPKAEDGSAFIFRITVKYQRIGTITATSPILEPPEYVWSTVPSELASQFDSVGRLFANTAGEVFDDNITVPWADVTLEYSINSLTFNSNLIFTHVNHANDSSWTTSIGTIPYYCAVLRGLHAVPKWAIGIPYYRVTATIAFRHRSVAGTVFFADGSSLSFPSEVGWLDVRANLGNMFINVNNKQQHILMEDGLPPRNALMLSGDGKTVYRTAAIPGGPIFVGFGPYPTANFSQLGVI